MGNINQYENKTKHNNVWVGFTIIGIYLLQGTNILPHWPLGDATAILNW